MKISEVSKKYELSIDTLRYYEKAGLLPNIKKIPAALEITVIQIARGLNLSNV